MVLRVLRSAFSLLPSQAFMAAFLLRHGLVSLLLAVGVFGVMHQGYYVVVALLASGLGALWLWALLAGLPKVPALSPFGGALAANASASWLKGFPRLLAGSVVRLFLVAMGLCLLAGQNTSSFGVAMLGFLSYKISLASFLVWPLAAASTKVSAFYKG